MMRGKKSLCSLPPVVTRFSITLPAPSSRITLLVMGPWLVAQTAKRTVAMALVHDLAEARTADHNYVNRRYVKVDESQVTADQVQGLPFGPELASIKDEFESGSTIEAKLARDADQLDLIFELKEHQDLGNSYAPRWIEAATKRLATPLPTVPQPMMPTLTGGIAISQRQRGPVPWQTPVPSPWP